MSFLKSTAVAAAVFLCATTANAITIYSEDFTGQERKGLSGRTVDLAGITNWSVAAGDATFSTNNRRIEANNRGLLVFRANASSACNVPSGTGAAIDCNATGTSFWTSLNTVNTSNYENLSLSIWLDVRNNRNFDPDTDDFVVAVSVDGDVHYLDDLITSDPNDLPSAETRTYDLSVYDGASDVQVRVYGTTDSTRERLFIDNVVLSGDITAIPLPASGLLLAGGLALFLLRRRK